MIKNWNWERVIRALALTILAAGISSAGIAQEEDTVESLYNKAIEQNSSGNPVEAAQTFEKLIELAGGYERLFEDYGAQAGGFFFDYGMILIPLQRWEDAKEAFSISVRSEEIAKEVQTIVKTANTRMNLSKFQLGFCEAQLGNYEVALGLYNEYIAGNPPPQELEQIRNTFKLNKGAALLNIGKLDEGLAEIEELFQNREQWRVGPQFLMQGVLEVGLVWVDNAKAAVLAADDTKLEQTSVRAHSFLDKYDQFIRVDPLDQFRFGFVDRLRKLGFESTQVGLYTLALRYFSYIPTIQDVRDDIALKLQRQPPGAGVPSQFQRIIEMLDEREKAEIHPDAENLRLVASCYERVGNVHAPRAIFWYLAEHFPSVPQETRAQILHEAARYSSMLGDYPAAQYFGEKFAAEMPEDHPLRNNVSTFMLQSLFTSQQYDQVIQICGSVRERYPLGDKQRELADALYPLALYTVNRYEEAEGPFEEYVKTYEKGSNREMTLFHRASNSLILGKMRTAAEQYEDFLKEYPESERFLDVALADLAVARFNLQDYPAAITASDKLEIARPDSPQLGRTLNIEGEAYAVMAENASKEMEKEIAEWRGKALAAYLAAADAAAKTLSTEEGQANEEYYRNVASEGLWKAADMYYEDENKEAGLATYDRFVKDYQGTRFEPEISIFSLEALEEAERGEEGLVQAEKMINVLGNRPPEEMDIELLRQAIGSYSEASTRIRGTEKTLATLDAFPGLDPANKALLTWLKIQKVIVLQESRKGMDKDTPEYAAVESQIAQVFDDLQKFEKRQLSEFALQQIGLYLAGTENPFLAVPYFMELLSRPTPEAEVFKAPAEMEIGKIEARNPDKAKQDSARERFRRIIDQYKDEELSPDAYLNLARLHMKNKEWKDAVAALETINKDKKMFRGDRLKRAEAGFMYGEALEELGDIKAAALAYLGVVSTYGAYYDYATQAWEKYVKLSLADITAMPENTPEENLAKRERELALYKLFMKYLYIWQKLDEKTDAPSGGLTRLRRQLPELKLELQITPEEQTKIEFELGITPESSK